MPSEEVLPFLTEDRKIKEQQDEWQSDTRPAYTEKRRWTVAFGWFAASILLNGVLLTILFAMYTRYKFDDPHHFARESIAYKDVEYYGVEQSAYFKPPSHEIDLAWARLADGQVIRMSKDEVTPRGDNAVLLPESSDYVSTMAVGHDIHCLFALRTLIYADHYHPNITAKQQLNYKAHADHCLNELLQSTLCAADTSIMVYHWEEHGEYPYIAHRTAPRTCVDWDALTAATHSRVIDQQILAGMKSIFDR